MSRLMDGMVRLMSHGSINAVRMVLKIGKKRYDELEGSLVVQDTAGEPLEIEFKRMFMLNPERVEKEAGEFINTLALLWPKEAQGRELRELRDGARLCDLAAFMRDKTYGIALLEYGLMTGKWTLRYDPNVTCRHTAEGKCPQHCTITIQQFNGPPRRRKKKKQREPIFSKFKLPDFAPQRGWAPA